MIRMDKFTVMSREAMPAASKLAQEILKGKYLEGDTIRVDAKQDQLMFGKK